MSEKTNLKTWLVILVLLVVVQWATALGDVIYVDDDALPSGDGLSWPTAYKYLQDALTAAIADDEIWVAEGTYKPDQDEGGNVTPGNRYETFQLINGVTIKGGYAGFGEPDPNVRNIELYESILSGDLNSNDVEVNDPCDLVNEATRGENSYHVVTGSGTDGTAVLDGFTITGGNANGSLENMEGGGMPSENSFLQAYNL